MVYLLSQEFVTLLKERQGEALKCQEGDSFLPFLPAVVHERDATHRLFTLVKRCWVKEPDATKIACSADVISLVKGYAVSSNRFFSLELAASKRGENSMTNAEQNRLQEARENKQ